MNITGDPQVSFGSTPDGNDRDEVYDALAELFLGESAPTDSGMPETEHEPSDEASATAPSGDMPTEPSRGGAPEPEEHKATETLVELVVLGHLPVFAAPWAAQHAAVEANRLGECIGLVRITSGQAGLELHGADNVQPITDLDHPPRTLAEAINATAPLVRRWMIRADAVDEPALAANPQVNVVTVLTGADDAAVVSAYRTIKGMAEALSERPSGVGATLRAAVMGVEGRRQEEAQRKLRRAVATFLDAPLEQAAPAPRITPASGASLFHGAFDGPAEEALNLLASRTRSAEETAARQPAPASPSQPPTQRDESRPKVELAETLSAHLRGFTSLETRCPEAPEVELAADEAGRLHMLASHDERAVESLLTAEAWARRHGSLLARAEPSLHQSVSEPTLHLLTQRPAEARGLLETRIRAHAIAPSRSGEEHVCIDLN